MYRDAAAHVRVWPTRQKLAEPARLFVRKEIALNASSNKMSNPIV